VEAWTAFTRLRMQFSGTFLYTQQWIYGLYKPRGFLDQLSNCQRLMKYCCLWSILNFYCIFLVSSDVTQCSLVRGYRRFRGNFIHDAFSNQTISGIRPERLRKIINIRQGSRHSCWDSNRELPEYKSEALLYIIYGFSCSGCSRISR
jgi:hypothetical protein